MIGWPKGSAPLRTLIAAFALLAVLVLPAAAAPEFPDLTGRIVDLADLLSAEDEALMLVDLEALEKKSTDQLVVVTLTSLQGYPIEEFGYQLGRHWGIGQKGKDNGVLLIVAPSERKVRIEVGRRLEPILTDALSGLIVNNGILPHFKANDYPGGIKAGVRDIIDALTGDAEAVRLRNQESDDVSNPVAIFIFLVWLVIVLTVMYAVLSSARSASKGKKGGWIFTPGSSSGSSGGWSGGGFSGGGGSFGGGGASGSW